MYIDIRPVSQFILPPGQVAPRGATCPGISYPPPWLSSPPGGDISRLVYLAPPGVKINQPGYLAPTHDSGAVTVQKFWNCY